MSEDVFPHLYRHDFVAALATGGPGEMPERRFLIVLAAMADHWSLVMADPFLMSAVSGLNVGTARKWLRMAHEEHWLSPVPGTALSLIHLPEGSEAYRIAQPSFEWHSRSHAPHAEPASRAGSTSVKPQAQDGPIPLTARALQLAAGSLGKTRQGRFAYIAFVQQSLMDQPETTVGLSPDWNRYLDGL